MLLREAVSDKDYETGVELFKEYASQLGVDLTFQNFNEEIENIRSQYSRPTGVLLIAYRNDKLPLGCLGIRKLESTICELKRMYLRSEGRGLGLGKRLLSKAIRMGRELGYERMRLDTLPTMQTAISLYKKAGFYEIDPYRFNPVKRTKYMEIRLAT